MLQRIKRHHHHSTVLDAQKTLELLSTQKFAMVEVNMSRGLEHWAARA
jgi:hypothetical protein